METESQVAKIIVVPKGQPESSIKLGERLTIGRAIGNQLVVDDQTVSRYHAEIRRLTEGRYQLSDLGSANGTWVNRRRLTVPKDLEDGDLISIGNMDMRFVGATTSQKEEPRQSSSSGTALFWKNETVIILVSDIRNYTSMSEVLPNREFSLFVSDWFRESSEIVKQNGGTVDKFIGDAVMVYWVVQDADNPALEVNQALTSAREMVDLARVFSDRLSGQFPGHSFRVGIGVNLGNAIVGNVGTGENQSFTIVGDSVNVAFRLEALTKEKGCTVIASGSVTGCAPDQFEFSDMGLAEVKGRTEPVAIWTMKI